MADFVNESNVATDSIEAVAAVSSSPTRPVLLSQAKARRRPVARSSGPRKNKVSAHG